MEHARPAGRSVTLQREACLTEQRPGLPCTTCRDTCPDAAISISDRHVEVSDAACSGCGRCAVSCPTGALTIVGFKPASTFECMRVNAGADEVVPCLGGIPPSHLRRALAAGDVTLMDRGWCAGCPVSGGTSAPWSHAVDEVNEEAELL
ncbi:MAG: 4Fe-4S binding protein, partial [Thioalkalivibrio sp.]|nr:4Fe-4S binding protein [Thioalkalivibrio sp.]